MLLIVHTQSINWVKWSAIGALVAAGATFLLAIATWRLVSATKSIVTGGVEETKATKGLAEATSRQAVIAAQALALQTEPRIVPVHESWPRFLKAENIGGSQMAHWVNPLVLEVANAGNGTAEISEVEIAISGWSPPNAVIFPGVLRPGAIARLRAEFTTVPPKEDPHYGIQIPPAAQVPAGGDISARVRYRAGGSREYQVEFSWARPAGTDQRWQLKLLGATGHLELADGGDS